MGSAPIQVGGCSAPVVGTVLSSVAGQPCASLSAFLCTHQSVDLVTVFMLGASIHSSVLKLWLLLCSALRASPHSQHYVSSLCPSLPAMLLHFLPLVSSCLPSLSQRYSRNSLGTTLCKEHTQSIPALPVVRWKRCLPAPRRRKASGISWQHSLILAGWAEEGAGKNWLHSLSSS